MIDTIKEWIQNLEKDREIYLSKKEECLSALPDDMKHIHIDEWKDHLPNIIDEIQENDPELLISIQKYLQNELALKETVMTQLIYEIYLLKCRVHKFSTLKHHTTTEYGKHEEHDIHYKRKHMHSYQAKIDSLQAALSYIKVVLETSYKTKHKKGGKRIKKKASKRSSKKRGTFRKTKTQNYLKTRRRI
jgi:hypothetical protein